MNTPNNERRKGSQRKIIKALLELIQEHKITEISVTTICKIAKVNRSTFYANYLDIYELVEVIKSDLEKNYLVWYREEIKDEIIDMAFLKLLKHIKENQILYNTYFKLGLNASINIDDYNKEMVLKYHGEHLFQYQAEFFRSGVTAIIKMWLANECKESPEEMYELIKSKHIK